MAKSQATEATPDDAKALDAELAAQDAADAAPPDAPPADDQPKGMYPSSPAESEAMIAERRRDIAVAQKRTGEDAAFINRLQNEIAVLNSLRQANGQGPL